MKDNKNQPVPFSEGVQTRNGRAVNRVVMKFPSLAGDCPQGMRAARPINPGDCLQEIQVLTTGHPCPGSRYPHPTQDVYYTSIDVNGFATPMHFKCLLTDPDKSIFCRYTGKSTEGSIATGGDSVDANGSKNREGNTQFDKDNNSTLIEKTPDRLIVSE